MKYLLASLTLLAASSGIAHADDSYLPAPQDEYQACREIVVASARIGKYDALHHENHYQALDDYIKGSVKQWGYGDKIVLMSVDGLVRGTYEGFKGMGTYNPSNEDMMYQSSMSQCSRTTGESIVNYDHMHNSPIGN